MAVSFNLWCIKDLIIGIFSCLERWLIDAYEKEPKSVNSCLLFSALEEILMDWGK